VIALFATVAVIGAYALMDGNANAKNSTEDHLAALEDDLDLGFLEDLEYKKGVKGKKRKRNNRGSRGAGAKKTRGNRKGRKGRKDKKMEFVSNPFEDAMDLFMDLTDDSVPNHLADAMEMFEDYSDEYLDYDRQGGNIADTDGDHPDDNGGIMGTPTEGSCVPANLNDDGTAEVICERPWEIRKYHRQQGQVW